MTVVLVAYATKHESTREVAEAIAARLQTHNLSVETVPAGRVDDVSRYDLVVLGGALYTGRLHPDAVHLLQRLPAGVRIAVFAMGPRTLAAEEVAQSRAQLNKALAKAPHVEPFSVAVFGGVVDPNRLRFPFNRMPASDARDWDAIRDWADGIAAAVPAPPTAV